MKPLTVTFAPEELPQLRTTLDRAMRTWEPKQQQPWIQELSDMVDRSMGVVVVGPYNARESK